ncbi:hypothetical protein FJZ17_00355 [Candidatus Pacearchaeota archaeon]|nr:hypothetical protein [Candidatus Pacearchaeota archaeon]
MFNQKKEPEKEYIREAFERVKEDIFNLSNDLFSLKEEVISIKNTLTRLDNELNSIKLKQITSLKTSFSSTDNPTHHPLYPTPTNSPTHNPTHPQEIGGLKYPNLGFSSGNRGVPTDRQTNQQTDNPTDNSSKISLKEQILNATEILNSLDNLRKEIRLKFKVITNQEMSVFSTLYELEQTFPEGVEYEQIAVKLKLSSSSIRDYIQRLISKGVPILKNKVNNKKILLNISQELKKIATLDTIIKLREL